MQTFNRRLAIHWIRLWVENWVIVISVAECHQFTVVTFITASGPPADDMWDYSYYLNESVLRFQNILYISRFRWISNKVWYQFQSSLVWSNRELVCCILWSLWKLSVLLKETYLTLWQKFTKYWLLNRFILIITILITRQ